MKNKLQVKKVETKRSGHHTYSEMSVQLAAHDTDINVLLPNGERVILQFRVESPSLDIILPGDLPVANWEGDDMQAAKPFPGYRRNKSAHILKTKQMVVNLPESVLDDATIDEKYHFAHVSTDDGTYDEITTVKLARKLVGAGLLFYDGMVKQSESYEHLYTANKKFVPRIKRYLTNCSQP